MPKDASVLEREPDALRCEADESSTSRTGIMDTLERGIVHTCKEADGAVSDTMEGARDAVQTTVRAMEGAAIQTSEEMRRALDLPAHIRRHPWLTLGGALLLGGVVYYLISRSQ